MSLPRPKRNESEKKFIQRAMTNVVMNRSFKDIDQRKQIALNLYDRYAWAEKISKKNYF